MKLICMSNNHMYKTLTGLSSTVRDWGFPPAITKMAPDLSSRKKKKRTKKIPGSLIPCLLVVFIGQLEILIVMHFGGSFCRYRKALYFWSLGISLYLELFCFLSFITFVLRNLCSGTHRRNHFGYAC